MQLHELFEGVSEVQRAQAELTRLKTEYRQLMKSAGSVFQSGVKPEYKDRVSRLKFSMKTAQDRLDHANALPAIIDDQRNAARTLAATRASYTPDQKKQDFSKAVSRGFDVWDDLRDEHGGDEGLDQAIHQAAIAQTEDGKYKLDVDQLAQTFGVPTRSMYKRLESPQLFKTAAMMPKNQ